MKKLPLSIGDEIFLRFPGEQAIRTRAVVLGARHGDFILIEETLLQWAEPPLGLDHDSFQCSYFCEGEVYSFESRIQRSLGSGLALIDYPATCDVQSTRKYERLQVHVATRLCFEGSSEPMKATMLDISQGGCYLIVSFLLPEVHDAQCTLDFTLPDGRRIEALESKVRNVHLLHLRKITGLGLEFLSPQERIETITSFCHYRLC